MSMLTPPGMGGQYRITGDKYPRMRPSRRRGRLVAAAVASAAVLGLLGWGTVQLIDVFTGGSGGTTAAGRTAHCRTKAAAGTGQAPAARAESLPAPGRITVNVYNATPRSGLAKKTAEELRRRGFRIGKVGNAAKAYDKKVKGPGLLLGSPAAQDTSLRVLATQLSGASPRADARKGADVDLIIGDAFKTLTRQQTADKAVTTLTAPGTTAPAKTC
ncbi:LytR C-terminal domain-containing protein [Streptomyces lavenduligriseus]|uniref:LytR C-terminal domain-containing protein n=1 Tax=Streptomyces lavenduligriseus TaxID=67315 RepID=A0ABT0NN61_9ACTN|nr:LytR C-terminal domain-containing protein [Streptomyces lavenduligriseus]MCL3992811.1 LytR C-terminal domain-containing protein [Streptomyces lavenduligriseus]